MSTLIKTISVDKKVRKRLGAPAGAIVPEVIELYNDKIVARESSTEKMWGIESVAEVALVEASLSSNNQHAIIFLVTKDEVLNGTQFGKMKMIGNPSNCIVFCSGMYSYAAANEQGRVLKGELDKWLKENKSEEDAIVDDAVYRIKGVRGRSLIVYENKAVINVSISVGSLLTGNASDGQKTIYYKDVLSVQYKPSGLQIGYLQLETASMQMNNSRNNFFNENSFTFDNSTVDAATMNEVTKYIKDKVEEAHSIGANTTQVIQQSKSLAEEIKELKELVDMGILTQEEFDQKKKQILGL